ncbi:MBL fold metallo-hydrolase [Gordonia rhizosphera]|uniref:MBL fold metallo-hydrolase n=1 Tax=Gordonia rhizosphera TaxID=83341 RepID=UPI00058D6220|nr:MBL fold metallo-hydrolase [Gordonia rhizosphera]
MNKHRIGTDVTVLADQTEVPGIGYLPINAFVLHADQPVVVDTGLSLPDRDFVATLSSVMDPADVRWIWLTHPDRDHTGGLYDLLDAAPQARVITTFLSVGILATERPLPMDRLHLVNPGQRIDVGDRTLAAFRPPLFDNPGTTGFLDTSTGYSVAAIRMAVSRSSAGDRGARRSVAFIVDSVPVGNQVAPPRSRTCRRRGEVDGASGHHRGRWRAAG